MDVTSPSLPARALIWQPRSGQYVLVVVVKATFRLEPRVAALAAEHEPLIEHDQHWDDDPTRFLIAATDVVPAKRRAEVVYVGRTVTPAGGAPVMARLRVGTVDKAFEARSDRWPPLGPVPVERRGSTDGIAWARSWASQPMPAGVGTAVFNAAPPDQQLDELPDDATIVLENLAPGAPTLHTALPGIAPQVAVELGGGRATLTMRADTLAIDGGRGIATVVWRGQLPIEQPSQVRRVIVDVGGATPAPPATPLGPVVDRKPARTAMVGQQAPPSRPLPFAPGHGAPPAVERASSWDAFQSGETAAIPVLDDGPAAPPVARAPIPAGPVAARPPPPPAPVAVPSAAPARAWGSPSPAQHAAPVPVAMRAPVAPPQHVSTAALGGVGAASDAAADGAAAHGGTGAAARRTASGHRLLWHDEASVVRIRTRPEWRPILTRRERRIDERAGAFASADVEDASEVLAIVREARPAREGDITDAIADGFDDEGRFEPELLVVEGELSLALDELSVLHAVVATTQPFVAKDEALRRAVETAAAHLASPSLVSPEAVTRSLTEEVRRTWSAWKDRPRDVKDVDELAARAVLEKRAYRVRDLFGAPHVRAAITPAGSTTAVPAYLPAAGAKKLPLFLRFPARIIAEVHPREDESEEHAAALRIVALARSVGEPRGAS